MTAVATTEANVALDALSDEALARRVRSGCAASFAELDRRMRPRLAAALRRKTRDAATCDDVAQQALLTAYRRIALYDAERRFATWLFTIAFRVAADAARARRRRPGEPLPAGLPDAARGPERRAMDAELRDNLWAVADRALSDAEYQVVWLRFGEGLGPAEVAAVTGKTGVHVRVLQHRGLKRLRRALEARGDTMETLHG